MGNLITFMSAGEMPHDKIFGTKVMPSHHGESDR
jgi:hypothetical protein